MYAYLQGNFVFKTPTEVHMDLQGVGYQVHISLHTFGQIENADSGKLFTYLHVKEDSLTIFGFASEEEKALFVLLISISGIGPNTARIILSSMTPIEVRTAIINDDDAAFKKVKGVGPKTAKRVTLELKDKIKKGGAIPMSSGGASLSQVSDQAIAALQALGFQRQKINKALESIDLRTDMTTEELIKATLQQLR